MCVHKSTVDFFVEKTEFTGLLCCITLCPKLYFKHPILEVSAQKNIPVTGPWLSQVGLSPQAPKDEHPQRLYLVNYFITAACASAPHSVSSVPTASLWGQNTHTNW